MIAAKTIKSGKELCCDYRTSDTKGNPDTQTSPEAYKIIIPQLSSQYGQKRAFDFVAHYIKEMYLTQPQGEKANKS